MTRLSVLTAVCLLFGASQGLTAEVEDKLTPDERKFREQLTGSVMIGSFTVDGKEQTGDLPEERYEILKISKLKQDYWTFNARIKYGDTDVTLPITLKVLWAGDTPMITLDQFAIPKMGTFDARVFFHGDRYAGTWQHGSKGGHMFGRIEKLEPPK